MVLKLSCNTLASETRLCEAKWHFGQAGVAGRIMR